MGIEFITLFIFFFLLALLLTGFPISFTLLSVGIVGFIIFLGPKTLYAVFSTTFGVITKDIYLAIPLFVLMATILQASGLASALYDTMYKWMAGLSGGLAIGTVIICTLIAAMTGLGGTGTVTMGLLAYPEMRDRGYNKGLAIGSIPSGGALGLLIPPSILMIIVGGFGHLSVGALFIGGIFPGLLISFLFCVYIAIRCFCNPELGPTLAVTERATWREKFASLRNSVLPILLVILVLGGIYSGACTPTEAGGIGAMGALICAAVYRKLNWQSLKSAMNDAFRINAMLFWIIIGGSVFASLLSATGVIHFVGNFLMSLPIGPFGILIVMLLITFILGMFIETVALVMITVPIFIPVINTIGIDPLWFGLLYVIDLTIGMITPPFGYNLFYFKGVGHTDVSMMDIYQSIWPFIGIMVIALILCIVFPEILIWLPNTMID